MYEMQIYIPVDQHDPSQGYHWVPVRPTGGTPYRYMTRDEAQHMLDICYPSVMLSPPYERRVVKVDD